MPQYGSSRNNAHFYVIAEKRLATEPFEDQVAITRYADAGGEGPAANAETN